MEDKDKIKLEQVPYCPLCGAKGSIILENCFDPLHHLPGIWTFWQCFQCKSLWMNPRPIKDCISLLYPEDYCTHSRPLYPLRPSPGLLSCLRFSIKLGCLDQIYGYKQLYSYAPMKFGFLLGKLLGSLPIMSILLSKQVGYTIRFLSFRPQGRLLDVGAGNGQFLWLMKELGWEVEGVEPDRYAAEIAASIGLKVLCCPIEEAPLEPFSYDAVTLNHVIEHLPDPVNVLKKLAVCLKPGGLLVCIWPNPLGLLARWFGRAWRELDPPRHLVLPSPLGLKIALENLGFKVRIWTTMRNFVWVCRESFGLLKAGHVDGYKGWFLPKVLNILALVSSFIFPNNGEEMICIAIKT
jgi:SAM-dependent methyltransferase